MTTKEFLTKHWNHLTTDELYYLLHDAFNAGFIEHIDPENLPMRMEEFEEMNEGMSSFDIAERVAYGNFWPNDLYWTYDSYGNFVSYDTRKMANAYECYANDVANYLEESGFDVGDYIAVTAKNRPAYDSMWKDYCTLDRYEITKINRRINRY